MAEELVKKQLEAGAKIRRPRYQPLLIKRLATGGFFGGVVAYVVWLLLNALFTLLGLAGGVLLLILQAIAFGLAAAAGVATATKVYTGATVLYIQSDPPEENGDDEDDGE